MLQEICQEESQHAQLSLIGDAHDVFRVHAVCYHLLEVELCRSLLGGETVSQFSASGCSLFETLVSVLWSVGLLTVVQPSSTRNHWSTSSRFLASLYATASYFVSLPLIVLQRHK